MTGHSVTRAFLAQHPLPMPEGEVDKDARGRVMVVGGNREVPGAVLLAGISALRAGAGKLQIATAASCAVALAVAVPEARVTGLVENAAGDIDPANAQAILDCIQPHDAVVLGPGMLDDHAAGQLAASLLTSLDGPTFVVDAAALTGMRHHLDQLKKHAGRTVMTPHAGEMATFLDMDRDAVMTDPIGAARRAAAGSGAVVIMKGSCTYIASSQGEVWASQHGNAGLATSGSGDTLAGIVAGLLARGAPPVLAAQWAVFIHGEAGDRLKQTYGILGYLAREIPGYIPRIMADLA